MAHYYDENLQEFDKAMYGDPDKYPPIKRPEMGIDTGRMKRSFLNRETNQYTTTENKGLVSQSFDSIIMECQDMLSVETEVKKRYEAWLGKDSEKKESVFNKLRWFSCWIRAAIIPSHWLKNGFTNWAWNKKLNSILDNIEAIDNRESDYWIKINGVKIWVSNYPFGYGADYTNGKTDTAPSRTTIVRLHDAIKRHRKGLPPIRKFKENRMVEPSESSKFQFLKESYSGTIENLNIKLDEIKAKIQNQISAHAKDKESLLEYADMFSETDFMVKRIDKAISALESSYKKVSEKKAEISKALKDYIGENGYIAEKEREIERLKVAQELSDRMQKNFHSTLEITKSVDVLTDTIIPGIKQLMSLKIPELIDKVNYECDKEKAFLDIAK